MVKRREPLQVDPVFKRKLSELQNKMNIELLKNNKKMISLREVTELIGRNDMFSDFDKLLLQLKVNRGYNIRWE